MNKFLILFIFSYCFVQVFGDFLVLNVNKSQDNIIININSDGGIALVNETSNLCGSSPAFSCTSNLNSTLVDSVTVTNIGFNIPIDATINSFTIYVNRSADAAGDYSDYQVQLIKKGTFYPISISNSLFPATPGVVALGNSLFNTTWSYTDVNSVSFF